MYRCICLYFWLKGDGECCPENVVDTSLTHHVEFLQFCFLRMFEEELDETRRLRNNYFVKKVETLNVLGVNRMCCFYTPSFVGERDCRSPFVEKDVNLTLPYCKTPELFGNSDGTVYFAALIMNERNITMPRIPHQVKELFITLLQNFDWSCVKRFFLQTYFSLLVCYLHVLYSDASKIWVGVGRVG